MKFDIKVLIHPELCDCVGTASQLTCLPITFDPMPPHILLSLFPLHLHSHLHNSHCLSFRCQSLTSFQAGLQVRYIPRSQHQYQLVFRVLWSLGLPVLFCFGSGFAILNQYPDLFLVPKAWDRRGWDQRIALWEPIGKEKGYRYR